MPWSLPISRRDLRLISGVVMLLYLASHLANHALGLISLDTAEVTLGSVVRFWRNPAVTVVAALPPARRKIITTHDAFGYFGATYGMEFIAPEGVSTESEASARDVAKIIRQIKAEKVPAVFLENVTDPRLLDQIARETGAKIGGTLFSDALSEQKGPAAIDRTLGRRKL